MRHWTTSERARQAELIRTWKPWKRSTGATTLEGKARSSQNSRKHGFYSREVRELQRQLDEQRRQVMGLRVSTRRSFVT